MTDYEKLEQASKLVREVTNNRPDSGRLLGGTRATPHLMSAHGEIMEAMHDISMENRIKEFVERQES